MARSDSSRMPFSFISIRLSATTSSPSVAVTRWWMPSPSTMISDTRLQSTGLPSGSLPTMASATRPTLSVVSTIQAWSSAAALAPPPLLWLWEEDICFSAWARFVVASVRWLDRVTVTSSGALILSLQDRRMMYWEMVVLYSGRGTRHMRPMVRLSSGSPVDWLRSSPLMVMVTVGSQWRRSRCRAHSRSMVSLSMLWSVSVLEITPYTEEFLWT